MFKKNSLLLLAFCVGLVNGNIQVSKSSNAAFARLQKLVNARKEANERALTAASKRERDARKSEKLSFFGKVKDGLKLKKEGETFLDLEVMFADSSNDQSYVSFDGESGGLSDVENRFFQEGQEGSDDSFPVRFFFKAISQKDLFKDLVEMEGILSGYVGKAISVHFVRDAQEYSFFSNKNGELEFQEVVPGETLSREQWFYVIAGPGGSLLEAELRDFYGNPVQLENGHFAVLSQQDLDAAGSPAPSFNFLPVSSGWRTFESLVNNLFDPQKIPAFVERLKAELSHYDLADFLTAFNEFYPSLIDASAPDSLQVRLFVLDELATAVKQKGLEGHAGWISLANTEKPLMTGDKIMLSNGTGNHILTSTGEHKLTFDAAAHAFMPGAIFEVAFSGSPDGPYFLVNSANKKLSVSSNFETLKWDEKGIPLAIELDQDSGALTLTGKAKVFNDVRNVFFVIQSGALVSVSPLNTAVQSSSSLRYKILETGGLWHFLSSQGEKIVVAGIQPFFDTGVVEEDVALVRDFILSREVNESLIIFAKAFVPFIEARDLAYVNSPLLKQILEHLVVEEEPVAVIEAVPVAVAPEEPAELLLAETDKIVFLQTVRSGEGPKYLTTKEDAGDLSFDANVTVFSPQLVFSLEYSGDAEFPYFLLNKEKKRLTLNAYFDAFSWNHDGTPIKLEMQDGGAAYISSQYAVFILSVDGERFLPEAVGNAPQSYGKLQYKLFKQNDLWHVLRDKLSTDIFLSDVKRFFASGVESGLVEGRLALVLGYLKSRSHDQTLADFAQGLTGFIRENHMALKDISILQDIETAVDLLQLPGVSTFNIEQGDYVLLTIAEDLDAEDSAEALKILTFNKRKSEVSKSEAASMRFYLVKNPDNNMQYNLFCGVTSDALQMVRRETVERNGYGIEIFVLGDSTFFDENSLVFNNDDEEAVFELYGSKNALFVKNLGTIDDMKNNTHLSRLEKQEKGFVFKSAMGELIDYDHGSRDYVGKGGEGIDFKLVAPVVATVAEEVPEEEVVVPEVVVVELKLDALEDVLSALRKNDKNYSQTEDIFVALWNQIYQEGYRIDEAGEAFSVVKPKLKKDLVKDHEDVLKQIKNKIHFDYKNNQKTVDDDSVTTKLNSLFSENDVSDLAPLIHRVLKELSALKPSFLTEVKTLQQLMSASNYDDAKVKVADLLAWAKEIKTTASKDAKIEVGAMLSNAPGVSSVDRSDRATVAAIFSALKNINSFLVSGKAVKVQTISSMASTSFQSSVVQPVAPKATASSATSRTAPASTRGRRGRAKGRDEVERVTQAEN